ncbi:hypothetical protein EMIT0111MI5_90052 [Burkholderia sp. IT-111MI5]
MMFCPQQLMAATFHLNPSYQYQDTL